MKRGMKGIYQEKLELDSELAKICVEFHDFKSMDCYTIRSSCEGAVDATLYNRTISRCNDIYFNYWNNQQFKSESRLEKFKQYFGTLRITIPDSELIFLVRLFES